MNQEDNYEVVDVDVGVGVVVGVVDDGLILLSAPFDARNGLNLSGDETVDGD
jgi:hypothetical protein